MTPERWQQVKDVLEHALGLQTEERLAFLAQACDGDEALRREVESLLAESNAEQSSFLESPPPIELAPGTRIGDYEIQSLLGAGGMGEVYRARDSRLRREVAIKVLPGFVALDPQRLRRFEQEAMAAAALSHPNILAVFQMGTYAGAPFLVSELLEGETLREEINRSRMGMRRAIDYGVQIVHGLGAAHEKGIVHRDLKPENLFVTKDGRIKILDFGLAKLTPAHPDMQCEAPTFSGETESGLVMGTVGYMSPEQVRGQTVDRRADIFAFGAILHEMLTGQRAFQKPTPPDTLSAILNEDPPGISQIVPGLPAALQRIVQRCLEKSPEQRFQSASDLAFAITALSGAQEAVPAISKKAATHWLVSVSLLLVVVLIAGTQYYRFIKRRTLSEKDTIVMADFANTTGDPVFDDTLKTALTVSLRQSPFLNILSDDEVANVLQQMTRPPGTKLTPALAHELCIRAGSKAYLAATINSIGSQYVLALKAVDCRSGNTLAQEQVSAAGKEKVLDTLGEAASRLRGELGESLTTVRKFDVPLEQATTPSLDALRAYSLGQKAQREKGTASALPYHQRAVDLDPKFAMAYGALGGDYFNLGEVDRARDNFTRAFQLRQHASERERLSIAGSYYWFATGELDKAAQAYQEEIDNYPGEATPYNELGGVFAAQGQYEKAIEATRQALRLGTNGNWYGNLGMWMLALHRFADARQIVQEAESRTLDSYEIHNISYGLAFLGNDSASMLNQQQWYALKPEYQNFGLALASHTEAYLGHLGRAWELTKLAVDSAIRADNKENAALWQADYALQQTAYGNAAEARHTAAEALKLAPTSQGVEIEVALAFAMAGDSTRADPLVVDLAHRFPLDTQTRFLWLPVIQAQLALNIKDPASALTLLQPALPIELANVITTPVGISCLYLPYIRGKAYLAAGQGNAAASEFQKIIDHSGIVWNCWTGALSYLGIARANTLQSRTLQGADADTARARALSAYKEFLSLWRGADPEIPILKQAKAEYASAQ